MANLRNGRILHRFIHVIVVLLSFETSCFAIISNFQSGRVLGSVFYRISPILQTGCALQCGMRTRCKYFNYRKSDLLCELSSDNSLDASFSSVLYITDDNYVYGIVDDFVALAGKMGKCASRSCPNHKTCIQLRNGDDIHCVTTECGSPPSVANTEFHLDNLDTRVGATLTYKCDFNTVASDSMTITCKADGTWTSLKGQCGGCGTPPSIADASISSGDDYIGTPRIYTCNAGYYATDASTNQIHCQSNAQWTPTTFTCSKICTNPPSFNGASTVYTQATFQNYIAYSCINGYILSGDNKLFCGANGVWNGASFTCAAVDCGSPPYIDDQESIPAASTTYGSVYTYECSNSYAIQGDPDITCQASGSWTTTSVTCVHSCHG